MSRRSLPLISWIRRPGLFATALDDVREKSTVPALKRAVDGVGVAVTSIIVIAGFVVTSLRSEIAATRNELKTEVASARNELKADGVGLRNEIKTEAPGLRGEMVGRFKATNAASMLRGPR